MHDRDAILAELRATLIELFELDAGRITLDARLYEELEIDSIDAIDLMDRLRRQTGRKIASERFRSVRTVSDLVDTIHQLVNET
ncbi:MAG: acyl carrier protein [Steroidobacteraceae bacterium]|nr:acyl carrier protein [Steroidobacteraceae bacterium]MBM2854900.1 acyl carrier protein [Steroidobacteraceae bacterium]